MISKGTWGAPLGFQRLSSLSSASGLTVPAGASTAVIVCTTQNVRWRDDGSDPTSTAGILQQTSNPPLVYRGDLNSLRFIETTASASVEIAYYGVKA